MTVVINIIAVFLLVLMNGFFVASEFAMVKLRESRLEALISEGNIRAKYCLKIKKDINSYLSACQLGITLASLGLGWLGEPAIAVAIDPLLSYLGIDTTLVSTISVVIAFVIITTMHIVLGELVPKSLAILNTEDIMLKTSVLMIMFYKVMYPVIWLFNVSTDLCLKPLGYSQHDEVVDLHTDEEIRILMKESCKNGLIDKTEQKFMDNIFDFTDKSAREIMTPRTDMVCLYKTDSIERILAITKEERYTRYPVCDKDKDNIIGIVHIKDIYNQKIEKNTIQIAPIIRKTIYVSETMPINKLLEKFQKEKVQMAIVMDEYGGTSGIVTVEDILEEIVGEIQDEFDNEAIPIRKLDNTSYCINGVVSIDDVNSYFGINIECPDYDSIGGWLYAMLDPNLKENQEIIFENYKFVVQELDKTRVVSIIVHKLK